MENIQPIKEENLAFKLPKIMTIETAEAIAAELKQLPLVGNISLTLDASELESITTPGLQLLVSLDKTLTQQGGSLLIHGKTHLLISAAKECGLESLLT